jgi:class 3 adenylate cyclase
VTDVPHVPSDPVERNRSTTTTSAMHRRLAAILCADIVGYSRLVGLDEAGTFQRVMALRGEVLEPLVAEHGGRIVNYAGDGALAEFSSVVRAVECALAVQGAIAQREPNRPADERVTLRIGIHSGDILADAANDLCGDAVNIAARLEQLAEPGGICLSDHAHEEITGRVHASFAYGGEPPLKNIGHGVGVWFWPAGDPPFVGPEDSITAANGIVSATKITIAALSGQPREAEAHLRAVIASTGAIDQTTARIETTQDAHGAMLAELLEIARAGGVFRRAADEGIPEAAIRSIVERLGGEGVGRDNLVSWLDNWIEVARTELGKRSNEGEAFEAARREAERRFRQGRLAEASAAFMEEFEREEREERDRQEERQRSRVRLLEEAIRFDELALDGGAAAQKLRLMADIDGACGPEGRSRWLHDKAAEFFERGDRKGENGALVVAIAAYRAVLEERTRKRVPLDWAATQDRLGLALLVLGRRESGTERLEEAIARFRAALEERTRRRVPLDWACTQNKVGLALISLGERESGIERLALLWQVQGTVWSRTASLAEAFRLEGSHEHLAGLGARTPVLA